MDTETPKNNMNTMNRPEDKTPEKQSENPEEDNPEEEQEYQRTMEDVTAILTHAKIDKSSLTEITQAIYFPELAPNLDNFFLMEMNPELMKAVENGETMYLKGGLHESAVLCTKSQTFDIKAAEISNSLLLIPELKMAQDTSTSPIKSPQNAQYRHNKSHEGEEEDESEGEAIGSQKCPFKDMEKKSVKKVYHEYFECTLIRPRYRKTLELLNLTKYSGPENEYKIHRKLLFTFNKLLDTAQCSEDEFEEGLRQARAFNIDGYIRKLDEGYEYHRCLNYMLKLIDENSWELNEIDEEVTISSLKDIVPEEVLIGLFNLYTEPSDIPGKFRYKEEMVSQLILRNILLPDLSFNYTEFQTTWKQEMPEKMNIDEKHLRGIGIIDRSQRVPTVMALREETLTTHLLDRLKKLFRIKKRWTLDEIEPYIVFFSTPKHSVTSILAKHARAFNENGVRYYVSRY